MEWRRWLEMLQELDPNDPGRWPITIQVVAWLLAFVAVLALGWTLVWRDQMEMIERTMAREGPLREQWLAKKRQAVFLPLYRKQLEAAEAQFGTLLARLPGRAEMAGLLAEAHQRGLERALVFGLFRPGIEVVREVHAELPVLISLTGPYHAIAGFVSDVSRMPRVVAFGDFSLGLAAARSVQVPLPPGALRFEGTLIAYRYLDERERSPAPPSGKEGGIREGRGR
ncbi:MAG: type 4a pilus biogenesis protein PilO [Hydrogenophilus sp.]|nr:type 4a pilus biogenesis protein PilO [Hydrogenophilus sp.]